MKAAFGYDATALYNHYMLYERLKAELQPLTEETQVAQPTQTAAAATTTTTTETLDPLPATQSV